MGISSFLYSIVLAQKRLMIVVNDEYETENNESDKLNPKEISSLVSSAPSKMYASQNWFDVNFDNTDNIQKTETSVTDLAEIGRHFPYLEKYNPHITIPSRETESTNSKSTHKEGYPHHLKNVAPVFPNFLVLENQILHYHEHEHFHIDKMLSSTSYNPRRKYNDSTYLASHPDQHFESTKNYYHQRYPPKGYGTRLRKKQNLHNNDQIFHDHLDYSIENDNDEYRLGFGQKKNPKLKRSDFHLNRHGRHPVDTKGRRKNRPNGSFS